MIYEIKLSGTEQDDGRIELHRLAQLAQTFADIARGALQIRVQGFSSERGRIADRITAAAKIKLTDLKKGVSLSTILEMECEPLSETLEGFQGDVFKPELLQHLPSQTPIGIVMDAFSQALNYKEENSTLDKNLLRKLSYLSRVFTSDEEMLTISNRGSKPEVQLQKQDFKKIRHLEESIPEPQPLIINGIVDELKFSKSRVTIATEQGIVNGILSDELPPETISQYWGKELTISGTAHFQPGGKMSFIYIEKLFQPEKGDAYFSKPAKKETVEQQIQRQQKAAKNQNQLSEWIGAWPGDESLTEILNGLDK